MYVLDRLALLPLVIVLVAYPALVSVLLPFKHKGCFWPLFACANVAGAVGMSIAATIQAAPLNPHGFLTYLEVLAAFFTLYFVIYSVHYFLFLNRLREDSSGHIAFAYPLLFLALVKYGHSPTFDEQVFSLTGSALTDFFIGASYVAFRTSLMVREVQNQSVSKPSYAEYLAFAFYVPALWVGPISRFSQFRSSFFDRSSDGPRELGEAALRILVGLTKYLFIGTLLSQLTYSGLLLDGRTHSYIDLMVAIFAYALYLYCNFSGFCDIVIGSSYLLGIRVPENFDRPFAARNLQEFWTRWHMTLSSWFRDMMFTPLLKLISRVLRPRRMDHVVALTILLVFLAVGIWHGTGLNFLFFGLAQGVGISVVHYYNLFLRRHLSKAQYSRYMENTFIKVAATAMTFVYFACSLFFFANTRSQAGLIFQALR